VSLSSDLTKRSGVLLVGHGTRDPIGTRQFFDLAKVLSTQLPALPVEPCLLELQSPTIEEGWLKLHDQGVERVLVAPLLLFSAGHAKSDIPEALNACNRAFPKMSWQEARPLSRAPELLRLCLKRLDESQLQNTAPLHRTALVMVGRGSYDPCAQADMKLLSHWISGRRKVAGCSTAFYAMAHPRLPVVLRRVATRPDIDSIIVQPHLLFEGALFQSILKQVEQVAGDFPGKRFVMSGYLGPESEIAEALVRRLSTLCPDITCPDITCPASPAEVPALSHVP
jgi:sirohydrochlorin cobaltochelatase